MKNVLGSLKRSWAPSMRLTSRSCDPRNGKRTWNDPPVSGSKRWTWLCAIRSSSWPPNWRSRPARPHSTRTVLATATIGKCRSPGETPSLLNSSVKVRTWQPQLHTSRAHVFIFYFLFFSISQQIRNWWQTRSVRTLSSAPKRPPFSSRGPTLRYSNPHLAELNCTSID